MVKSWFETPHNKLICTVSHNIVTCLFAICDGICGDSSRHHSWWFSVMGLIRSVPSPHTQTGIYCNFSWVKECHYCHYHCLKMAAYNLYLSLIHTKTNQMKIFTSQANSCFESQNSRVGLHHHHSQMLGSYWQTIKQVTMHVTPINKVTYVYGRGRSKSVHINFPMNITIHIMVMNS